MKYFLILLISLSTMFAKDVCILSENDFYKFSSQKAEVILPKDFILGENEIEVVLEKAKMPSGFMVPVVFDLLEFDGSVKPEIISGYPKSSINIKEKGYYKLNLKINLVYKTSCGGIQFSNLLTKKIEFQVK